MRKELGIDQKQVFELLGITRTMYSRIENGHARLTIENAQIIEDLLGIGIEWLLYGDEEKKVAPVGQRMEQWLWKHKDVRVKIWRMMLDEEQTDQDTGFSLGS